MVSRGVPQLKNIRLYFCDYGGSSQGVRAALKSDKLADYFDKNEHLEMEISMRRNYHPTISATYINGYIRDIPLRNLNEEEVIGWFERSNTQFGRRPLRHAGNKNLTTEKKSIQGEWTNTLWNQYPKHMIEARRTVPFTMIEPTPDRDIKMLK